MIYKTISNVPENRRAVFYPWCYWDNAFSDEELEKMCSYFEKINVEKSTVFLPNKKAEVNENWRISNIKFYDYDSSDENTNWIFERFNFVIEEINNTYYNFNLNGYNSFQYAEYESSQGGKYDFHMDTIMGRYLPNEMPEIRKLSLTMFLNESKKDYEGGEFEMDTGGKLDADVIPSIKGRIIAFPSFMIHRVKPVTRGKRKSIVIWVTGPKFI